MFIAMAIVICSFGHRLRLAAGVAKSSASSGWGKGGNVTSVGWQVTLCDSIWRVSSCGVEAGLLTEGEPLYRV